MATLLHIFKRAAQGAIPMLLIGVAWPTLAAWNAPTCNPDTVGPTDPSCNVAAPLNVSAAGQSKLGKLEIQSTLSAADLFVDSTLGGSGNLDITTATGESISVTHNSGTTRAVYIATNSNSPAVQIDQAGVGVGLDVSSSTVGILATGSVEGISASGGSYAGTFTTAGIGAVLAENTGTDAAIIAIGGADPGTFTLPSSLSGFANGGVYAGADQGYGIAGVNNGSSTTGALLGYSKNGFGIIGYSDTYEAVYGNTDDPTSAFGGYFCNQQTNCAGLGGPVYAGYFNDQVIIDATSSGGTGLMIKTTAGGSGFIVETDTGGTGGAITTDNGGTGLFVKTSNGTGTTGVGINVTVDPFQKALETNDGFINNGGGYDGGVIYPNENAGGGLHPNVENRESHNFVLPDANIEPRGIEFDGSDIWVAATNPAKVFRFDAATNHMVEEYLMSSFEGSNDIRRLLHVESDIWRDTMFVFGSNAEYQAIPLYGDKSAISPSASTGATGTIFGAAFDGDSIWLSTDQGVFDWDFENTRTSVTVVGGIQSYDIIFADGLIWASDINNNVVNVIDPKTRTVLATVPTLGLKPRGLAYDGQYVWVANVQSTTLSRIHSITYKTEIFDIASLGSQPRHLVFDGAKLWVTMFGSGGVGSVDVSGRSPDQIVSVGQSPNYITSDGTNVWVSNTKSQSVSKIPTGAGYGTNPGAYQNGFLIAGQDDVLYCIYIDPSGAFRQSTALNNCGF